MKFLNVFILLMMAVSVPFGAYAQNTRDADVDSIAKAETYMQKLTSAQARFVQTTHDGAQLVGTFYLQRPGKMRFEYDPPIENFVVADGLFIYFYDADLEEQTNAPIRTTLANFFLRENFSLSDDLIVQNARFVDDILQIKVVQAEERDAGSITFAFSKDPFQLKKWRVVDAQGLITEVELFHMKSGVSHEKGLFTYVDPKRSDPNRTPRYNQ